MGLTVRRKTVKRFSRQAYKIDKFKLLVVKKINPKVFSGDHNGKISAVNRKQAKAQSLVVKAINTLRLSSKGHQYLSDKRLTLETSSHKLFYGSQFTFSILLIILNYPVILSHRRSTTVSLETYPLFPIDSEVPDLLSQGAPWTQVYNHAVNSKKQFLEFSKGTSNFH